MAHINAVGLGKAYVGRAVLNDVTFAVRPGLVTGLLGPNGAGKSTTIRLMLGLDRGDGHTHFDGVSYPDLDEPIRRVGVVLEPAFHPKRTAWAHLALVATGAGLPRQRCEVVLDLVGLSDVANRSPRTFSLGMRQRLALAQALLGSPDTLILDEPTTGLDPQGQRWLRRLLGEFAAAGGTVLISSHLLTDLHLVADRLVVMAGGRLLADSTVEEFIAEHTLATVHVRCRDAEKLARALGAAATGVERSGAERLVVRGISSTDVAVIAAQHGCLVTELGSSEAALEEAFLQACELHSAGVHPGVSLLPSGELSSVAARSSR